MRSSSTEAAPPDPAAAAARPVAGPRKWALLLIAGASFALGVLGAILPGLPATPFLLLTSYFLARSSPRLNSRLLRSRLLGGILRDWQTHRSIRRRVKLRAIAFVVAAVGATLYFSSLTSGWKWAIAGLAVVGVGVVLRLPVLAERQPERLPPRADP